MSLGFSAPAMSGTAVSPRRVYENTAFQDMDSKPVLASLKMPNGGLRCRTQSPRAGDSSVQSPLSVSTPPMSPCASSPPSEDWIRRGFQASPRAGGAGGPMRADIAAACQALGAVAEPMTHPGTDTGVMEHPLPHAKKNGGVPVFVMLPLDSIKWDNTVNRKKVMNASLQALKSAGVEGIMMDVWWGLVEREAPGQYNWDGYRELIEMIKRHGLKVQAVMSFHQCGGNVGDSVCIPLPKWVVEEIDRDNDLAYTDQWGRRNYEYVSLGADNLPVLKGRSPVQCYADFMRSFKQNFKDLIGETIVEIQVGMGPAGELRYPSYPEANGTWRFPGIGAFQCYDKYMLADLKAAADQVNKPEWGHGGPTDAGSYNNWPEDTPFFKRDGGWSNEYGEFFLSWYSNMLLSHGERILGEAEAIFRNTGAKLSGKVAGIHWHYGTRSHAPELTAGYYNTRDRDGYGSIAQLFARHGVVFNFTCIEMKDYEQPQDARCSPEGLIKQVILATRKVGVPLAGENALMRFDEGAYSQILNSSSLRQSEDKPDAQIDPMCAFTFLRMCPEMFQSENWRLFVSFVKRMSEGSSSNSWEQVHREAEHFVHVTRPLVQEAAAFA